MKRLLIVRADTNDADYVTSEHWIQNDKELEKLTRIFTIIEKCDDRHNWPSSDYDDNNPYELYEGELSEDDIMFIEEYIPYGEHGVHTIESVKLYYIEKTEDIL